VHFSRKGVFHVKALIKKFWADEKGLETIEYAIMIALIVAGLIAVVGAIGTWVLGQFQDLQTELNA
jgi:Flp pilus assembly pilin Flp